MRAVDAIMECLKAEGVDVVFGLPGGANLPTYDAFVDAGIRHVLVRHEAGGGHAAEGYAKATGKVGVSLGTSGPGATNLVTPIVDAMMDSVPVVFLTGQVRTDLLGTDGFQEADTIGITMPAVKHSVMIQHPLEIPRAIHEAFYVARSGRPGPVVVDIPTGPLARGDRLRARHRRAPARLPADARGQRQADPPGRQGARGRTAPGALRRRRRRQRRTPRAELVEFATADRFPVTCTLMGLGAFPGTHPQWLGMLGMHGTRAANYAMDEADLICAIGARFDDRITGKLSEFAPRAKFIHIDVDPAEISKNIPAHIPIVGDAKHILAKLVDRVPRAAGRPVAPGGVVGADRRTGASATRSATRTRTDTEISPQYMVQALYEATGGQAIVCSRRRPAPDVDGAVLPLPAAAPLDQLRWRSGRWASACRRRWARRSAARTRRSSASPATARSR